MQASTPRVPEIAESLETLAAELAKLAALPPAGELPALEPPSRARGSGNGEQRAGAVAESLESIVFELHRLAALLRGEPASGEATAALDDGSASLDPYLGIEGKSGRDVDEPVG